MEKASLNALNVLRTRADVGEEALELRIPMSSFGENQRFRGASEWQDRSPEYPDTAASSPSEDIMPEVGSVVKLYPPMVANPGGSGYSGGGAGL